jgi:hypothetical protein
MTDGHNIGHLTDDPSLVERQADTHLKGHQGALINRSSGAERRFP